MRRQGVRRFVAVLGVLGFAAWGTVIEGYPAIRDVPSNDSRAVVAELGGDHLDVSALPSSPRALPASRPLPVPAVPAMHGCVPQPIAQASQHFQPRLPRQGERLETDFDTVDVPYVAEQVATLALPSHRFTVDDGIGGLSPSQNGLIASGPSGPTDTRPLVALHSRDTSGDRVYAFELVISTAPVVRWDEDPRASFGTDGGLGRILSPEGQSGSAPRASDPFDDSWLDALNKAEEKAGHPACVTVDTDRKPGVDLIFLNTPGDGYYPGILGYDRRGQLAAAVILIDPAPWALMGLTGIPPGFVVAEMRKRGAPIPR